MYFYPNSRHQIYLGDIVQLRRWFIWRDGVVVYVPGISPKNKEMEFNGLVRLGVQLQSGLFVALFIDPETNGLPKRIKFIRRGTTNDEVHADEPLFE